MSSPWRRLIAASSAAALLFGGLSSVAEAAPAEPTTPEMTAVPSVQLVPRTTDSYPFNAADHARVPLDLASHGYVEQEFFLSGYANVYTKADGTLGVERTAVPYTNRILVRHPANTNQSSGTVLVDIYNASNGYDIEDMWRRLHSNILLNGHTYIGVTSKPINVDALYHFDADRYSALTWYDEPAASCERSYTYTGNFDVVPCTETGLVWDILTQVGNAVRDPEVGDLITGGAKVKTVLLVGQSQSSMYLNTYVNNFHNAVTSANGGAHVYDGYLSAAGNWIERSIRDGEYQNGGSANAMASVPGPASPVDIDVPWIYVDSESDTALFEARATMPRTLDDQTRVWQIAGTGHTYSWSPVVPDNAEVVKAGRPARTFPDVYTPYPMEPAMIAATQALIDNAQKGKALPASRWFERDADGSLIRDDHGNTLGGVRYGLMELPLAQFLGFRAPGDMHGVAYPISTDEFHQNWNNRSHYLAKQRAFDNKMRSAGYLTADGQALFAERANLVLDRIGIPA